MDVNDGKQWVVFLIRNANLILRCRNLVISPLTTSAAVKSSRNVYTQITVHTSQFTKLIRIIDEVGEGNRIEEIQEVVSP